MLTYTQVYLKKSNGDRWDKINSIFSLLNKAKASSMPIIIDTNEQPLNFIQRQSLSNMGNNNVVGVGGSLFLTDVIAYWIIYEWCLSNNYSMYVSSPDLPDNITEVK